MICPVAALGTAGGWFDLSRHGSIMVDHLLDSEQIEALRQAIPQAWKGTGAVGRAVNTKLKHSKGQVDIPSS